MSPQDAHRLVGHSPDIVERVRTTTEEMANFCSAPMGLWNRHSNACLDCASEVERLRTALRAVRACTDPAWAAQIIKDALREEN
jgi:hypothetical protein